MRSTPSYRYKIADKEWEVEAVCRLLYKSFVEEIPQYQANADHKLVDKFDRDNRYLICLDGSCLAGMITLRDKRPFSLDQKLPNLDEYLPPGKAVCEFRLLTVDKNYRHSAVLPGLLKLMEEQGRAQGFEVAVISASVRQLKLYGHIGFVPFGPLVGNPGAEFQPMMLQYNTYKVKTDKMFGAWRKGLGH
jgi:hypothetical protein